MLKCMLDVDGVVCDLVTGILGLLGRKLPEDRGDEAYNLRKTLGYRGSSQRFWQQFPRDFWSTLPKTKEADTIVELAWRHCGKDNVCFSTHPTPTPGCVDGKLAWVERYYPGMPVLLHCGDEPKKGFVASNNMLLIDDCTRNVVEFRRAGGHSMLIARPWNRDWELEDSVLPRLAEYLDVLAPITEEVEEEDYEESRL